MFLQCFVAQEGRKVGMKWCREAHFEVKIVKIPHVRSSFASWDIERVHAALARSTFRSQNGNNTTRPQLLPVEILKAWTVLWREAHFNVKVCTKHRRFAALFEVEMLKKWTALWREAHFEVKMFKTPYDRTTLGCSSIIFPGRRKQFCTEQKVSQRCRFCSGCKNDSRHGTFEENLKRCISHGRRSTRDISGRHVNRSGRWFLERGFILEQQTFRFAKTIFRGIDRQIDRYTDRYTDKQIDK